MQLGENETVGTLLTILTLQVVGLYWILSRQRAFHGDTSLVSMFKGAVRVALLEQAPYLATQSLERSKRHCPVLADVEDVIVYL
jgi:hypothetical protein